MLPIIRPTNGPAIPATAAPSRAGAAFRLPEAAAPSAAALPAGLGGPAATGLLGLQELAGHDGIETAEAVRDRHARRHGRAMLDGVAALQLALLRDTDGGAAGMAQTLAGLESLLEDAPVAADPGLRALLESVTLRLRVELARHGR